MVLVSPLLTYFLASNNLWFDLKPCHFHYIWMIFDKTDPSYCGHTASLDIWLVGNGLRHNKMYHSYYWWSSYKKYSDSIYMLLWAITSKKWGLLILWIPYLELRVTYSNKYNIFLQSFFARTFYTLEFDMYLWFSIINSKIFALLWHFGLSILLDWLGPLRIFDFNK